MRYDAYSYLWPPRPDNAIPRGTLGFYERRGYWAQVKKNGTCTVIFARADEVIFMTRHNDTHRSWAPLADHRAFFAGRPQWNVYVAELLHSKTPTIRHHLYLFDVIVADGEHLVGQTFAARQELLAERFPRVEGIAGVGVVPVGPYASRAVNYVSRLEDVWRELRDEDEGLVLKSPDAPLAPCFTATANGSWQVKCRRSTKNYSF
jgi:hypothetical protein